MVLSTCAQVRLGVRMCVCVYIVVHACGYTSVCVCMYVCMCFVRVCVFVEGPEEQLAKYCCSGVG